MNKKKDYVGSITQTVIAYSLIWVFLSILIMIALFCVLIPFLYVGTFTDLYPKWYFVIQVFFTVSYICAIIKSAVSPIKEREENEDNGS